MDNFSSRQDRIFISILANGRESIFSLGRVNYIKAEKSLSNHIHPEHMEIVCMIKGVQHYSVNGCTYQVKSGQAFIAFADEPHSSGSYPEDKALFYYLIFNPQKVVEQCFAGFNDEMASMVSALHNLRKRVFNISAKLISLLDDMINISTKGNHFSYYRTKTRNLVSEFLMEIIANERAHSEKNEFDSLIPVLEYINRNLKSQIKISELAEIAGISEARLKAKFRACTGLPPREYILRKKVEAAKSILQKSDISITDLAYDFTFSSSQYFATVFRRFTNQTPSEYRKMADNKPLK